MANGTINGIVAHNTSFFVKRFTTTYSLEAATISSSALTPQSTSFTFDVAQEGWTPLGVIGFDSGGGIHPCPKVILDETTVSMVVSNYRTQSYSNRTATIDVLYYKTE